MPIHEKGKYINEFNIDKFKNDTNRYCKKIILYEYYIKLFKNKEIDTNKFIQMHPSITKLILKFSNDFVFIKNSETKNNLFKKNNNNKDPNNKDFELDFDGILYKGLYPLDISSNNYLYLKMLKFHFGLMQFIDLYGKYHFDKISTDEILMNDYLNKKFISCLQKTKDEIGVKANELNDFQLISNICVRERLTLFNFLLNDMKLKRNDIKKYINNQYMKIFRQKSLKIEYTKIMHDLNFEKDLKNNNIEDIIKPYNKTY
jgi:hypothetical protein